MPARSTSSYCSAGMSRIATLTLVLGRIGPRHRQLPDRRRQRFRLPPKLDDSLTLLVREQHLAIADGKHGADVDTEYPWINADLLSAGHVEQVQVPVPAGN